MALVPIDRSTPERARATVREFSEVMHARNKSVLIAPEGTRKAPGGGAKFDVGPFKMGAFFIAKAAAVPIAPWVIVGAAELLPLGRYWCQRGTVTVRRRQPQGAA